MSLLQEIIRNGLQVIQNQTGKVTGMTSHRGVYQRDDGTFGTIPDGDDATLSEVIEYIKISTEWVGSRIQRHGGFQ
jgi:hypothetical protein